MKKNYLDKAYYGIISLVLFCSCSVDNSYDLSKDIDLTMALSGNGLAVKLGGTEKMYLKDILKVDDSDLLDTISSGTNMGLYYLDKKNDSEINFNVDNITPFTIDPVSISTGELFKAPTSYSNLNVSKDTAIVTQATMECDIKQIPDAVEEIHKVSLNNVYATIAISIDNSKFKIASYNNLKIKFPDFIKSSYLNENQEYVISGSSQTFIIPIESVEFPVNGSFGQKVVNGEVTQSALTNISGDITIATNGTVNISEGETAKAHFVISISQISPIQITGLVNPSINPTVDPINISSELPDFLKDDAVQLSVTSPTVKFTIAGENIPVPLLFCGVLNSIKKNQTLATASIPESGRVTINKNAQSEFYFSQTGTPFDPLGKDASAQNETVSKLNTLIKTIPDNIQVDLDNGKITTDKSSEHSIELGKAYSANINYEVLVPFQFDKGLTIVYNDSVSDLNKDLKNYLADGVTITADALNTIPLNLNLDLIPCDVDGNQISDIKVTTSSISAGSLLAPVTTSLSVTCTPTSQADISKIDKLKFKVTASSSNVASGEILISSQYVQLTNVRIKLNGKIITNFN